MPSPPHGRSPGLAERVAWLRRGKRIADALVEVAEQAGETRGLSELLERVCRLTVERMPADRCTIYLWNPRRRAYVLAANCGSSLHLAAGEGHHRRLVQFEDELSAQQLMVLCRDHRMSAERFDTLEAAELHSLVTAPLPGRTHPIGAMTVGLQRPPCFDEDALETLRGVARHTATLIEKAQLRARVHKAAALRAKLGAFAVRLGSRNDPRAIGQLACAEGAGLFRASGGVMLLREGDALVPCGSSDGSATALASLRIPLSEHDRPTVQAFHGQRPVIVSDFAATASDDARARYPELKCMIAIPLVGRAGPMGCLVYADRRRTHRFSAEVAADGVLLGAIVAAALEHAQTLGDALRANAVLRESEERLRTLIEHGSDIPTIVDAEGTIQYETPALVQRAPGPVTGILTLTTSMEPLGGSGEAELLHELAGPGGCSRVRDPEAPAETESQMGLDVRRGVESGGALALLAHVGISIEGGEGSALAQAAHALERSCWTMGAGAIRALRWGIEHLGQASVLAAARETLARAEEELRYVRAVRDERRRSALPRDP